MRNLEELTGRTPDEWAEFIRREGPATVEERRTWLKAEHGMGTNYAAWLANRADGVGLDETDPEAYLSQAAKWVEAMYAGPKAALRPLHDMLLAEGRQLGDDVRVCPCKTIVPLVRKHVFAQIKPTTRTRIDLGLALKDTPASGALIDTGGYAKGDRISHRIAVSSMDDITDELRHWLRAAYTLAAP